MTRSCSKSAAALLLVFLLATVELTSCSRRSGSTAPGHRQPNAPDSVLIGLTPYLHDWIALWRLAAPTFEAGEFQRASEGPFTLRDIRRYDFKNRDEARRRRLFASFAPDSMRFVDPDRSFDVHTESDMVESELAPDSSAALVDLKIRSIATIETRDPVREYDGAFWLGVERFALTGTAQSDSTDARYGFVRAYDLDAGTVIEFRTPEVDTIAFRRFAAARDSVRVARVRGVKR